MLLFVLLWYFFFFSSRRRHTRWTGDWSSDVCSSDLDGTVVMGLTLVAEACRGYGRPEPAIGILRLGSGNAIADTVGATDDTAADLGRLGRGHGAWRSEERRVGKEGGSGWARGLVNKR